MKKLFFDFRRNIARIGVAALTVLTVANAGCVPVNIVSAESIEEGSIETMSSEISTYAVSTFSKTIKPKTTELLLTFGTDMKEGDIVTFHITTFSGTGPLVLYISSSASTAPSTGETVSVKTTGTYSLTIPENPAGKHLYGVNQGRSDIVITGWYSHS